LNLRRFFVSSTGALLPPWRIGAFAVLVVAATFVAAALAGPILIWLFGLAGAQGVTVASWVQLIALIAATAIAVRNVDKRPWSTVWLDAHAARPSVLTIGFVLGALCIGLPTVVLAVSGWLGHQPGPDGSWWAAMFRVTLVLLPAAFVEELVTRGYLLSVLREWWGWRWAIFATSAGFGLLHLRNPGATVFSLSVVTLAGVFLGTVLYATRSLYAAWMAHFAWNWTLAAVFHASVSGLPLESPGYRYVDAGPDWATGGEWGPEGGIPAVLGMIAGIALLVRWRRAGLNNNDTTTQLGNG
jgi:membrane protease YdiL (CAAX protease family)